MAQTIEDQVMSALQSDDIPAGFELRTSDLFARIERKDSKVNISAMHRAIDLLEQSGRVVTRLGYDDCIVKRFVRLSDKEIPRKPNDALMDEALDHLVDERF